MYESYEKALNASLPLPLIITCGGCGVGGVCCWTFTGKRSWFDDAGGELYTEDTDLGDAPGF